MENPTKNQHFVSQAEQRSNCIDESVPNNKKRIYKFSIVDREEHTIQSIRESGVKIERNLSFSDLFSFEVKDGPLRKNLESFFQKYETDLEINSRALVLEARRNAGASIVTGLAARFLKAKLMGVVRNPYCIDRTLTLFQGLGGYVPTDAQQLSVFESVLKGSKPHSEKVCAEFGISPQQYLDWLSIIYLALVVPPGSSLSVLESIVDSLIASPGMMCHLIVATFDDIEGCRVVLPDTGYLQGTEDPHHSIFMFNVNKNAYAAFSFINLNEQTLVPVPEGLRDRINTYGISFSYQYHHNAFKLLGVFNALAVYQSIKHVFCADKIVYGVNNLCFD